jgi:hypothetical protein
MSRDRETTVFKDIMFWKIIAVVWTCDLCVDNLAVRWGGGISGSQLTKTYKVRVNTYILNVRQAVLKKAFVGFLYAYK